MLTHILNLGNQYMHVKRIEAKIEESEKAGLPGIELNPGYLASALSYDKQTTPSPHNPLHVLQKPGVLGSIPSGYRPFHLPLFLPQNI